MARMTDSEGTGQVPQRPVRRYDQYRACTCGHIKGHHAADEPWACRMTGCTCESFMPKSALKFSDTPADPADYLPPERP